MAVLEEVKKMQQQGLPETEIIKSLQDKGVPYRDISEALSQSKIRSAIEAPVPEPIRPAQPQMADSPPIQQTPQFPLNPPTPNSEAIPGMQKSMMQPKVQELQFTQEQAQIPEIQAYPEDISPQEEYGAPEYETGYDQPYEYSATGISPDTITEISEQVVSERISEIRKPLEKIMDFKTTIETKTEAIEERLKRIEKIIDTLQSSVLRKVGDYVTNIGDIKKELIETQKSFAKLAPGMKKHTKKTTKRKTTHRKKK
jgi:DNA-binding transcriptional MerR regulator